MRTISLLSIAALILATAAHAQDQAAVKQPDPPVFNPLASNNDFLAYHPDLDDRRQGMETYQRGEYAFALRHFRAAARYADKPSQAMLASMYWDGKGVSQDRARAYAWMDLAAERGYPFLLANRERYWEALNADERKRAVDVGQSLYAEYGDDVAKPRLEAVLRQGLHQVTGSHTGFVGTLALQIPSFSGSPTTIDANQYYDPRYWKPQQYWAWADRSWKEPTGKVNVGALEAVRQPKPAVQNPPPDSRKQQQPD